ncbi:MAG TPA: CcmD family protein [Polyangia bacterium]|nr:CcmD family protein [Polyangia bacterium]
MTTMKKAAAALAVVAATLAAPALAFAQEFEKISGKATEEVPAGPFVGIAYSFIWIALLAYVVSVARGVVRVKSELRELRAKLDAADKR